jgi:DNA-binding transcriptional ArsR family regulator
LIKIIFPSNAGQFAKGWDKRPLLSMALSTKKKEMREMAEMLKAIAHPERLAILSLLSGNHEKRLTVKVIYEKLKMQQPVASRHLNILKSAGVVSRKQEGQKIYYCICKDRKAIDLLTKCLC